LLLDYLGSADGWLYGCGLLVASAKNQEDGDGCDGEHSEAADYSADYGADGC
jgi:hypothetical protein